MRTEDAIDGSLDLQNNISMHTILRCAWAGVLSLAMAFDSHAQDYVLTEQGDTINRVDSKGLRQGPWILHVDPLRGQPGYEEEGMFRDGKKEGPWRRFTLQGDLLAFENYKRGFRDGKQTYFTKMGELLREESWKAVDPAHPYDTIEVPDLDNPMVSYTKVVKLESDEVRHGTWTYYNPLTGAVMQRETFVSGQKLRMPDGQTVRSQPMDTITQADVPPAKAKAKPKAVEDWEKKNAGKKRVTVRDGRTGG